MQTGEGHGALHGDTVATLIAGAIGLFLTVIDGVEKLLDENGARIVTALTIISLALLCLRHAVALIRGRP